MATDSTTDALLNRLAAGDMSAREVLIDRHRNRLKRMVQVHLDQRLANRFDPSDVVQESLAEASRRLSEYARDRPIAFYPWLRQIAWDQLLKLHRDHLYAQRRAVSREVPIATRLPNESIADLASQLVGRGSTPSQQAVRQEMIARVRTAIDGLSESHREVIILRYIEPLSIDEIAAVLGITAAAVRGRQFRAIERLHAMLQTVSPGDDLK